MYKIVSFLPNVSNSLFCKKKKKKLNLKIQGGRVLGFFNYWFL